MVPLGAVRNTVPVSISHIVIFCVSIVEINSNLSPCPLTPLLISCSLKYFGVFAYKLPAHTSFANFSQEQNFK